MLNSLQFPMLKFWWGYVEAYEEVFPKTKKLLVAQSFIDNFPDNLREIIHMKGLEVGTSWTNSLAEERLAEATATVIQSWIKELKRKEDEVETFKKHITV